jgi:hypothetical protein
MKAKKLLSAFLVLGLGFSVLLTGCAPKDKMDDSYNGDAMMEDGEMMEGEMMDGEKMEGEVMEEGS